MTTDIQYLTTPGTLELRGGSRSIGGMALTFGTRSKPIGGRNGFIEVVSPSFITSAKATGYSGIIARYSHMDQFLLGATDSGTLRISDNSRGLDYTVDVPEYHSWVYDSVARGDCRASSFSFVSGPDESDWDQEDGVMLRTLRAGELIEVSPTPVGQYPDASVGLRSGLRSLAAHVDAPYSDVEKYYQNGELAKFVVRSDRPAPAKTMGGREALEMTLAAKYPEVGLVSRSGKARLAETMAARARSGRERLLETLDESAQAKALRTTPWEALRQLTEMATPPVYATTEVSIAEYLAIVEIEASRKRLAEIESRSAEVARPPEPPRRTLTGAEALRILDSMRPSLPPSSAGRASDAYLSES
jgi:uncharacterized protein